MDVIQVASLPISTSNRTGMGAAVSDVQASSAVSSPASPKVDTSSPAVEPSEAPSSDRLAQAVKQVNDSFIQRGQNLYASFEKDKITGINVVKIVDKKTNETISQMPPKELVEFAQIIELPQGWRGQLIHDRA